MKTKKNRDLTIENMPHNRLEVFFDIIKQRWDLLLKIALILTLFLAPFIFSSFLRAEALSALEENSSSFYASYFETEIIFFAIDSFALILLSLPIAGILRISKLLSFYEGIWFFHDLMKGIKENWLQVFVVLLLDSLILFLSRVSGSYLLLFGNGDFFTTIIFFLPAALGLLIILPASLIHLMEIPIYKNTYFQNVKNAFYFYFKSGFTTLPVSLLLILPLFLNLLPFTIVPIIVYVSYAFVYLPFALLFASLYSNYVFDKFLNKNDYPEIYDKGIYRTKKD